MLIETLAWPGSANSLTPSKPEQVLLTMKPSITVQTGCLLGPNLLRWALLALSAAGLHINEAQAQHVEESHQHGQAELLIVTQDNELQIQLRSPAANITGFEEAARNEKQRRALNRAKRLLLTDEQFRLHPDDCKAESIDVDFSSLEKESAHAVDHAKHHAHKDSHADIIVTYHFACVRTDKLETITTQILTNFPSITELHAQWVVDGRQGAATLDNSQDKIQVR
jgi:hypothetical protein